MIGNPENLRLAQSDYTVVAWVNLASLNPPDGYGFCNSRGCNLEIVSKMGLGQPEHPNQNGWRLLKEADNQFWFMVGTPDGASSGAPNVVQSRCMEVAPGRWYHLATVTSSQEIALYVSGILQQSKPLPSNYRNDDVAEVVIGQYPEEPAGTIYESRNCKPGATTMTTAAGVTSTTMLPIVCGDANGNGSITVSDALQTLIAAVGVADCDLTRCDINNDGSLGATDALMILRVATGLPVELHCWEPRCP